MLKIDTLKVTGCTPSGKAAVEERGGRQSQDKGRKATISFMLSPATTVAAFIAMTTPGLAAIPFPPERRGLLSQGS